MAQTLAFDVYGTLIDTQGITRLLERRLGGGAGGFAAAWREKQLEYTFRRGLMRSYATFEVCTAQALDHVLARSGFALSAEDRLEILDAYQELPAFVDVREGLRRVSEAGFRLFAFSNGTARQVRQVLAHAGILEAFQDVVSVDEVQSFKPDPAVYAHFLRRTAARAAEAWLVSSNPFDVLGALSAGMQAAWVKRSPEAILDPWGLDPALVVDDLAQLAEQLGSA